MPFEQMQPIDQYILARTAELTAKITKAYADFEFHRVYHLLNEFLNSELSAFYLDVLKDRLYTYPVEFKPGHAEQERLYVARRSAQTAIYKITDALARLTAPHPQLHSRRGLPIPPRAHAGQRPPHPLPQRQRNSRRFPIRCSDESRHWPLGALRSFGLVIVFWKSP